MFHSIVLCLLRIWKVSNNESTLTLYSITISPNHYVHYLLQLRGFRLRGIPFMRSFGFVPFLHLRINKSSLYAIFGKNL